MSSMERYEVVAEVENDHITGWAVWDMRTNARAVVDGTVATGLKRWEARQTAGLLNTASTHEPQTSAPAHFSDSEGGA